jgi:hypothetical protein
MPFSPQRLFPTCSAPHARMLNSSAPRANASFLSGPCLHAQCQVVQRSLPTCLLNASTLNSITSHSESQHPQHSFPEWSIQAHPAHAQRSVPCSVQAHLVLIASLLSAPCQHAQFERIPCSCLNAKWGLLTNWRKKVSNSLPHYDLHINIYTKIPESCANPPLKSLRS